MGHISGIIWLFPVLVHVAYVLATYAHMPEVLSTGGSPTAPSRTPLWTFFAVWVGIVLAANLAFILLARFLPRFSNRSLKVPGQVYWLSTSELREELIDKLRGICEAMLFGLNVFFLAVYQMIYQTNGIKPVLTISLDVLVLFFMVGPLVVACAIMFLTIRGMAKGSKAHAGSSPTDSP